ncbi:MAG TPA: cytochrome C oxidase subunit IV family protein [Thermoanaerobaculia bacterium]|nr:cytochrome C oxidase subunit IV family protein [Thermoanaerobaculia bacterium]
MEAHAHDADSIRRQTRIYVAVFGALAVLTLVTVTVSYLHLSTPMAILVALVIASIKGSLVAAYFMHLISERKAIYGILILTVVFFAVLMSTPSLSAWNQRMLR